MAPSAGSALAVASGEVPLALGTDTAGSGRVPAALCDIVGTKPTRGLVPTDGVFPAMASFDCVSWFTADTADGATVLDVLTDAASRPPAEAASQVAARAGLPTRIGVPTGIDWCGDDDARQLFEGALDDLRARGFTVVDVDGAVLREAGAMLYGSALTAERHLAFGEFAAAHADEMEPGVAEIVTAAGRHDLAAYIAARAATRTAAGPRTRCCSTTSTRWCSPRSRASRRSTRRSPTGSVRASSSGASPRS